MYCTMHNIHEKSVQVGGGEGGEEGGRGETVEGGWQGVHMYMYMQSL